MNPPHTPAKPVEQHTPTPWQHAKGIASATGFGTNDWRSFVETAKVGERFICIARTEETAIANAAFLCRACNAHEELVAVLKKTVSALEDVVAECEDATGGAVEDRQHDVWLGNIITECNAKLAIARAVLTKATVVP